MKKITLDILFSKYLAFTTATDFEKREAIFDVFVNWSVVYLSR